VRLFPGRCHRSVFPFATHLQDASRIMLRSRDSLRLKLSFPVCLSCA
jgi:hypothetical protein